MSKNVLKIDISSTANKTDGEDIMSIELKNKETVEFNFSKLFFSSKYLCEKHPEIKECIEREISEIISKNEMKDEIIKEFIEIISKEKINIPIEHYKDIYTLSAHFCIDKLTKYLDKMMDELFLNDLNFSIQILQDNKDTEIELSKRIENFLTTRVNECLKNQKFKGLPIPTIYRIINSAMATNREAVDISNLFDFIVESPKNRFILLKFIELDRLSKDKLDEFIKFVDDLDEKSKQIYLEYIPFNFLFIKKMKREYEEVSKHFQQNQAELKQTQEKFEKIKEEFKHNKEESKLIKEELDRTKEELTQTKEELTQTKEKLTQTKEELTQAKEKSDQANDAKQCAHTIIVGGYNQYDQLGKKSNKNNEYIPSQNSSIDPSSLLSFSTYYCHTVEVTSSGKLLGIGYNYDGRICDSLPKTEIKEFTEFSIRGISGRQLDPISAVCSEFGTLYMFSSGSMKHLVLCDLSINGGHPVFLDIDNEQPVSLFGGRYHSAAISNKGEIIFINRSSVQKSPDSKIKSVCLPDGEKAVSVACCKDSVIALSSNGRVFLSVVKSGSSVLNFSAVSELSDQEIVCVSGTNYHFLAVSREGRVFGRGSNSSGQLGLGQEISNISSFTEISSLNDHKIKSAYAGSSHSLFETREGKILACGYNYYSELLLNSDNDEKVYSPIETTIKKSAAFCIAGLCLSTVFVGGDPPPNTPKRLIEKYK